MSFNFIYCSCRAEDGRFEIGDMHETGLYNHVIDEADDSADSSRQLKRSRSTGDLVMRRGRLSTREEPRYHLDSDHSSQHDERPEEVVRRLLALPPAQIPIPPQSSLDDTTTSDSLNADLEVCGILGNSEASTLPRTLAHIGKKSALDLPDSRFPREKSSFSLSSESSEEPGRRPGRPTRIRISDPEPEKPSSDPKRPLETDSSNDYESETGIPKSPTLYISGVSISRTPEPRSPALLPAGRTSRSSSLTVPETVRNPEPPAQPDSPLRSRTKSKSANEPEREREVFRFPKSSTDGALSSVLHVQESNLSSDDFHEALFLLEHSPKDGSGVAKRRKRSKKDRTKDKENSVGKVIPEASSVL